MRCFFVVVWVFVLGMYQSVSTLAQANPVLISTEGSSRATAYSGSNKIWERGNFLYLLTLDYKHNKYILVIRKMNKTDHKILEEVIIDDQIKDNHGGGSLVMDSHGFLHVIYGPHIGPFTYKKSLKPNAIDAWSKKEQVGNDLTYPSMAIDHKNKLYLVARSSPSLQKWTMVLLTKEEKGAWSAPLKILIPAYSPWRGTPSAKTMDYSPYMNTGASIAIGSDNILHLGFKMYHYLPKGQKNVYADSKNGIAYMVGHIYSRDGGKTWYAYNKKLSLPVLPADAELIDGFNEAKEADGIYEVSNLTLDANNVPYIAYAKVMPKSTDFHVAYKSNNSWIKKAIKDDSHYLFAPASIAYYNNQLTLAVISIPKKDYHPARIWGHISNQMKIYTIALPSFKQTEIYTGKANTWFPAISQQANVPPRVIFMKGSASSEQNEVFMIE